MKAFFVLLLCIGLTSATKLKSEDNPFEIIVSFLKGFSVGLNQKGQIQDLAKCIDESGEVLNSFNKLWEQLKKIDPLNFDDFIKIIELGTTAWNNAVLHVGKYPGISEELLGVYNSTVEALSKSILILCSIIVQPQEMLKWIVAYVNAVTYFDSGLASGHILFEFVYNQDVSFDANFSFENFATIAENYFDKLVNTSTSAEIKDCFSKIVPLYKYFKGMIIEILKIKDPKELVEALAKLFNMALEWIKSIKTCQCFPEVVMKMLQKFIDVNPDDITMRAKRNYNKIIADFADFVKAFFTKDYELAGRGLGDVVLILIYNGKVELS